jgi:peroxiredoxin
MDAYRDQYAQLFGTTGRVTLLAISVDSLGVLADWARERAYPFSLLSDRGGSVGKLYGAYESEYQMDNRTLYVIAPGGKISYVSAPFREIDPGAYRDLGAAVAAVTP